MLTAKTLELLADAAESHADDPREGTPADRRRVQALHIAAADARMVAQSASGFGTPETLALAIVIDNDRDMAGRRDALVRELIGRQNARAAERGPTGDLSRMTADDADAMLAWQRGEDAGDLSSLVDAIAEMVEELAGFEGFKLRGPMFGTEGYAVELPDVALALARAAFRNVDWFAYARHHLDEARRG